MNNDRLWWVAKKLAARQYNISYEMDTLTNGQRIILLRHPELPAVKAQGIDLEEAKRNLDEARVEYIYSLLEDDLPVPAPAASSSTSSPTNGKVWNINVSSEQDAIESFTDKIISVDDHEHVTGLSFGGDLVKQG